jgi:hypothetical protein
MRGLALATGTLIAVGALTLAPARSAAQQRRPAAAPQTIVIHGQVPTPQVVTVRPRQVPAYDRKALGAAAEGRSFWTSIRPGYALVPHRQITGQPPHDATLAAAPPAPPPSAPPAGPATPRTAGDSMSAAARTAAIDSMRNELATRRARLDSLERAVRGLTPQEQTVQRLGAPTAPPRSAAADSAARAARAAEIEALFHELERRRARLDSLEAIVRTLGRPRTTTDSAATQPDRTPRPR